MGRVAPQLLELTEMILLLEIRSKGWAASLALADRSAAAARALNGCSI